MLNILKNVSLFNKDLLGLAENLSSFEECKNTTEVLEILCIIHKMKVEDKVEIFPLTNLIYGKLLA